MTMEISKTEKALRLIATEGISAKEAAERVGISGAAVSKGKLWPSKSTQNIRKFCEMENEIESLRSELAALKAENEWQPMETAPKDEAWIVVTSTHNKYYRACVQFYDGHWYDTQEVTHDDLMENAATHWMPLPKPPAMAKIMKEMK